MQGLARDLNAKGVKTSRGGTWKGTTVREVLISPRYAGLRAYRGEIVGKADWPATVHRGRVARCRGCSFTDPARVRRPHNGYGRKYLLTGLIHCGLVRCYHGQHHAHSDQAPDLRLGWCA